MKSTDTPEAEVRRTIDDFAASLRGKDLERLFGHYAPDVLSYDLAPPLRHSAAELRRGLAEWFETWEGPIGYEQRDLTVVAGGDLAFAHSLNRMHGRRTGGGTTDVWFRATVCLRRLGGRWRVAHEHTSVPFHMDGSYRAAVELRP